MANISAVISDLGGVIVHVDKSRMATQLQKYSPLTATQILGEFSATSYANGVDVAFGKGLIKPEEFYEKVKEQLRLQGLNFQQFKRIYSDIFSRNEQVISLLRALSKKYKVGLLSNTDPIHFKAVQQLLGKDMEIFGNRLSLSFEIGSAKPEPEIWLRSVGALNVQVQQCAYIDDVPAYVKAASKLGLYGIYYASYPQLVADFRKAGITVP